MGNATERVLIIGFVWPEPASSAAGTRMLQLIDTFLEQGWEITFASAAAKNKNMVDLEAMGVAQVPIKMNSSSFDEFVNELDPTMVIFDRFVVEEQFGWRVAEQCPDALRILDTEDLHFLRRARKKAAGEHRECTHNDLLASADAKRELASIYRSDLSLIISDAEKEILEEVFEVDPSLLWYLPFLLDSVDGGVQSALPTYVERQNFMTIGNFRHPPNIDAVRRLKKEIWPLIYQKLPDAELHIYGAYVTQEAEEMHDEDRRFLVKGRAASAKEVITSAKVMLAPLRFGAGLKGKLIESLQYGTPSITSSIGAEGIAGSLPWGGAVADDSEAFAAEAVRLYSNIEAWEQAQENGYRIINRRFGEKDFGHNFIHRLQELRDELTDHRRNNFVGQMLKHHTMASSKYMSRWIEEKNKNR